MATTTTANATSPRPTGQGFGGDEFSNNLFSDLAPLLTLFGEQVTKQFLSMSMGWTDDVLLALGPLGIMTVIVSAIRVGGVKVLKAFVGRARESQANAEKEILSSTSTDVCELWSGQEIVRELGSPEGMKDLVLLERPIPIEAGRGRRGRRNYASHSISTRVLDINSAVHSQVLHSRFPVPDEQLVEISNGAPNIALNVRNSTASTGELLLCATIGSILQLGALAFPAITTYHLKWSKGGSPIATYGYPCFAVGTLAVSVGVLFCGRVIEGSTTEHEFEYRGEEEAQIQLLRLQRACTVSDQHFSSFAIFNSPDDSRIRTSRLNKVSFRSMTAFATFAAIIGFVAQFVGLRALHWSATIVQLGVMLIMTIVRSVVRRGLAEDPMCYRLSDGHELAWLTLYILRADEKGWAKRAKKGLDAVPDTRENSPPSEVQEPEQQSANRPDVQSVRSTETGASSDDSKRIRIGTISFKLTRTFPYVSLKNTGQRKQESDAEYRMLDAIVRWEPLTGYWNVKYIRRAMKAQLRSTPQTTIDILRAERYRLARVFTPLPTIDAIKRAESPPPENDHLRVYRDLERTMPASTEATYVTNTLALAIERVFVLFTKSPHILWREDQDVSKRSWFYFGFSVVRGSYSPEDATSIETFYLQIIKEFSDSRAAVDPDEPKKSTWKLDREVLSSILSLWLFALEMRRAAATKAEVAKRSIPSEDDAFWIRGYTYVLPLLSRRNVFFRIVSSGSQIHHNDNVATAADHLDEWLGSRTERVPFFQDENPDEMASEMREEPDNMWVVWGSTLSSSFNSKLVASDDDTIDEPSDEDRGFRAYTSSTGTNYDVAVRTRADTTTAGHCALEIFLFFLDAIVAHVEKLGGRTRRTLPGDRLPNEPEIELPGPRTGGQRWLNTLLVTIANECVALGLAHDAMEANTVIVPIFLKYGLLPEAPHEEIKYSRDDDGNAVAERGGKRYHVPTGKDVPDIATAAEEKIEKYMIPPTDSESHQGNA